MFCTGSPKSGCRPHGCSFCRISMAGWYMPGWTEIGRWGVVAGMRHDGVGEGGDGRVMSSQSCIAIKYRRFGTCEPGAAPAASPDRDAGVCAARRSTPVKTTAYAKETPFFISDGELSFANSHELKFRLYRVFEFRRAPRLFELRGRPDRHCRLDPTTYRASFC